jgi:FkbM family methyltransferase
MKLKEVFFLLGMKPRIRRYACEKVEMVTPDGQTFHWARWLHPKAGDLAPDLASLAFFRSFLQEGDVCIDIGAHVGDTTLPPALVLGKSGLVIALEPNPATFEVLEKNAEFNRDRVNIHPIRAAAMERPGRFTFKYADPGLFNGGALEGVSRWSHASAFEIEVEGIDLVDYIRKHFPDKASRVRFIKTDTEGHDFAVFRSLRPLIEQCRPVLECEINRNMHVEDRDGLLDALEGLDYRIYRLDLDVPSAARTVLQPGERASLPQRRTFDILAVPGEMRLGD